MPFIVNGAFAIELYLKTLHVINTNAQKGHKLLTLFNGLPEAVQISIKLAAKEFMINQNLSADTDLLPCLYRINSAFED